MSLSQRLIAFINENLVADSAAPRVEETESLFERGVIDSMGLLQLMTFIEQETGVRIPDDEVLPENFQSVASMEAMVRRLQAR